MTDREILKNKWGICMYGLLSYKILFNKADTYILHVYISYTITTHGNKHVQLLEVAY